MDDEELKDEVHDMDLLFDRHLAPAPKKLINSMITPSEMKKQELGMKIKDTMEGILRKSRISVVHSTREPSIISKMSRVNNFDFLSLRTPSNKLYRRVNVFLDRYKESRSQLFFTDYMSKIDSKLNKQKRILFVTEKNLY